MTRIAGLRGKLPARHVPELELSRFRTLSPPPPSADVSNGVTAWGMLGNDTYGDCGVAAFEHYRMAKAGALNGGFVIPSDAETESLYFTYGLAQGEPGPQPDQGVQNATFLKWLFDEGHISGYAQVDHTNADEVHAAMIDFNGVLVGVNLTDDAQQLFGQGLPWTIAQGETADPNMGHDILLVKYDQSGDTFVTWGAEQASTIGWDGACVDEAWVIISTEDAARSGIDLAALQAEIKALGGTETPPAPVDPPQPLPPDPGATFSSLMNRLKAEIAAEIEKVIEDVIGRYFPHL